MRIWQTVPPTPISPKAAPISEGRRPLASRPQERGHLQRLQCNAFKALGNLMPAAPGDSQPPGQHQGRQLLPVTPPSQAPTHTLHRLLLARDQLHFLEIRVPAVREPSPYTHTHTHTLPSHHGIPTLPSQLSSHRPNSTKAPVRSGIGLRSQAQPQTTNMKKLGHHLLKLQARARQSGSHRRGGRLVAPTAGRRQEGTALPGPRQPPRLALRRDRGP